MNCSTFVIEPQAAFFICIGKFLSSSGPTFSHNLIFQEQNLFFVFKLFRWKVYTNIIFVPLSILKPKVLNVVPWMIQGHTLLGAGKTFS